MDKNDRRKVVPRVCIIGGKAAPGYEIAKKIIKLSHAVAEKINNDTDIGDLLKLASFKSQLFICVFFLSSLFFLFVSISHYIVQFSMAVLSILYFVFGISFVDLFLLLFCRFLSLIIMSLLLNW